MRSRPDHESTDPPSTAWAWAGSRPRSAAGPRGGRLPDAATDRGNRWTTSPIGGSYRADERLRLGRRGGHGRPRRPDRLLGFDNVLLTPHMAARPHTAVETMSWVVRDVVAVLNGQPPTYPAP